MVLAMTDNRKHIFNKKSVLMLAGILFIVCAGGIVMLSKGVRLGTFNIGAATSIPIIVNGGMSQPSVGDSGKQDDKYNISIELSDGQSQPQTVEVLPLATSEPLSLEEIELILSRLPALPPAPDEQA